MERTMMDIKVERMLKFENGKAIKAYVDININDAILIKSLRVLNGKNGLFVSMPKEQAKDKKWYETVKCLDKDLESTISKEVLSAYLNN